jgi:hypothetical protein
MDISVANKPRMVIKKDYVGHFVRRVQYAAKMLTSSAKFGELNNAHPAKVLLLCHDANRGYIYQGKKYSQLIDSINQRIEEQGLKTITLATPISLIPKSDAYGNVVTINGILLRAVIADKVKYFISRRASANNSRVKAWGKIFDLVQPAIVIGIQPTPEMCIAAKKRGIYIADLQHGLVYDRDIYGYYGKGHRKKYDQQGWPDCVLCWDQPSADFIKATAPDVVDAKVIGNPWFLRFISPRENDSLVNSVVEHSRAQGGRPIVLVTLQWGMDQNRDFHPLGMPRVLYDFIQQSGEDYTWWMRLHPVQMQEPARTELFELLEQEFGQCRNVFWRHCSEDPLPVILMQVSLHLTAYSAVTVEASWFNVSSGLLDERQDLMNAWFAREISEGIAETVSPDMPSIKQWLHAKLTEETSPRKTRYISSNNLETFLMEIKSRVAGGVRPRCLTRRSKYLVRNE